MISNASDAADKLRFESLSNDALLEQDADLSVRIEFDKDNKTVTISDNGIGMSREEVITNLGTIAKSGTAQFLNPHRRSKERLYIDWAIWSGILLRLYCGGDGGGSDPRAGDPADSATLWRSNGESEYSIEEISKADRGTSVTLF